MRNSGLYVHVPFCLTKCVYCDFYSITQTDLIDEWLLAVEQEAALYGAGEALFNSLYIGGGTPSLLGEERLARLFEALHRHFTFSTDAEITAEANPDDATRSSLSFMKSLGVNRLSLGIQSFDDRELAFLKRRHDSAQARGSIGAAMDAGFSNIGLDLIYGLPDQTNKAWKATLEQAVSFRPAHVSCYLLTVEGEAPLAAMAREGKVSLPGEERLRSLFLLTSKLLESRGFIHYEVSNFAASEALTCRHNDKYWTHAPYLGLGPAAHSFDGRTRWWNVRSVAAYCEALKKGKSPVEDSETLTPEQLALERCYLGARTKRGISLADLPPGAAPALRQLSKARLVRRLGDRLIPTTRGFLVADSLPVLLT
ncbi:MAG TPA: radical SAM family heme chaperone HemW [Syntrophorhabdales bacterium]|nr:radical SAM family heme chaperone HemW [Syntrophorhabdales bacterium]